MFDEAQVLQSTPNPNKTLTNYIKFILNVQH